MTEQQEPNQQALAELAQTLLHLSRALDEAHNLAASAIEDRDYALTERDELREVAHTLCSERDELRARIVSATALCGKADMAEAFNMGDEWQGEPGAVPTPDMRRALRGEHGEAAKRDRLIGKLESATREAVETVAGAFMRAGLVDDAGREVLVNFDYAEVIGAMAERLLAEAVDHD